MDHAHGSSPFDGCRQYLKRPHRGRQQHRRHGSPTHHLRPANIPRRTQKKRRVRKPPATFDQRSSITLHTVYAGENGSEIEGTGGRGCEGGR